ncbi:MAG: hypothetical protein H5T34_01735 [Candidatus Methanomethyliales bacterium]|nr:hypothetical protein [Candidatus Methanomethylicales archaeon]
MHPDDIFDPFFEPDPNLDFEPSKPVSSLFSAPSALKKAASGEDLPRVFANDNKKEVVRTSRSLGLNFSRLNALFKRRR